MLAQLEPADGTDPAEAHIHNDGRDEAGHAQCAGAGTRFRNALRSGYVPLLVASGAAVDGVVGAAAIRPPGWRARDLAALDPDEETLGLRD